MAITWNPSDLCPGSITLSNGDLTCTATDSCGGDSVRATESKSSGKWYWEIYIDGYWWHHWTGIGTSSAGICDPVGQDSYGYSYRWDGKTVHSAIVYDYGDPYNTDDIIGIALDLDEKKIWFAINNVWQAGGDPANGTGSAFSSIPSGSYFPMHGLGGMNLGNYDTATARFTSADQTYSPPSGFAAIGDGPTEATNLFDGKIRIKSATAKLLDGKLEVGKYATTVYDGKVNVKTSTTKQFNGRLEVIGWKADKLDGKVEVTGWAADKLDGKVNVANLATSYFNGKVVVSESVYNYLDGKINLIGTSLDLLDGKVAVEANKITRCLDGKLRLKDKATGFLDGKVRVEPFPYGETELPFLNLESYTGWRADLLLSVPENNAEATVGRVANTSIRFPELWSSSYTGAIINEQFPCLSCGCTGVTGNVMLGNVRFPNIELDAKAAHDIIAALNSQLFLLQVNAKTVGGVILCGDVKLPLLHTMGHGIKGAVAIGDILLEPAEVSAKAFHDIIGYGEIVLPIFYVPYSSLSSEGECRILKYNRWE